MITALVISLGVVAVGLFAVMLFRRTTKTATGHRGDDGAAHIASDTGSSDCSATNAGCDGGGGGGD